jgi:hypothetical protein
VRVPVGGTGWNKRLMLGTETCCYRDGRGNFRIVLYRAIKRWDTTQTPEVPRA